MIAACQPRHRHQEFLRFLNRIDETVDSRLQIHLVLDNYGTHKHLAVKKWLAVRPRDHVHFTPLRGPIKSNAGLPRSHEHEFDEAHFAVFVT